MSLLVAGRIAVGLALLTALVAVEVRGVIGGSHARHHIYKYPSRVRQPVRTAVASVE